MKVSDYDVDFSSGLFTCCMTHVLEDHRQAKEGMVIECEHCNKRIRLTKCDDGQLRWRAIK